MYHTRKASRRGHVDYCIYIQCTFVHLIESRRKAKRKTLQVAQKQFKNRGKVTFLSIRGQGAVFLDDINAVAQHRAQITSHLFPKPVCSHGPQMNRNSTSLRCRIVFYTFYPLGLWTCCAIHDDLILLLRGMLRCLRSLLRCFLHCLAVGAGDATNRYLDKGMMIFFIL